ncbi:5'-nucleotidase C-terminal domain-containing protein [Caloranaerobacter azorensis]|uniref:LysM peptidoglycan-binding domain-containing protein n=1 Tax=Caloranaerobacter azorensis TaxID=116090 RepID=A0A6P1YC56_9FIRM|nr:5'-nucleotidase C-terminal domain-containing protein [Caloranaerobacter azorensis]QIB26950.1 LysM peptidoglycan-binding domain-containing protein [Caloranaerobacter azorensis]
MKRLKKLNLILVLILLITLILPLNLINAEGFDTNPKTYTVKSGDVLWKIAESYGFDWKEIAKYNKLKNPHLIFPGQKILIPSTIKRIDILTSNDFHGKLEGGYEAGAAKFAAYMQYYKNMNPEGTIILNAGDAFQGTPMSNLLRGKPVVEMMNMIGFDAMTVGNHEFDWGIETILDTLKNANFEFIVANIYENGKPVNWAKPYTIIEKNGVKIGIIGLATPETAITAHADYVGSYEFKDPVEICNKLIPEVKKQGADIIIILSHLPASQDKETKEITGELADLAKGITGADAAIGGHSHQQVAGIINDIPVIQAYKHGRMIGHITLYYDTKAKKVVGNNIELIEVRKGNLNIEPDAKVQAMVDKYNEELKPIFGKVIGKAETDILRDYNNESAMGNWITDVMRKKANVQIAFTNAGGIRADLTAGDITIGNIFEAMPFDNTIVTGEMTGAQIKAILEQSVTLYKGMLQISGIKFTYDSTKPEGERVIDIYLEDGTPIEMDKTYTVATNDFLSGGQDGFVTLKEIKWTNTFILLRDALIENIRNNKVISPKVEGRITDVSKNVSSVIFELPNVA